VQFLTREFPAASFQRLQSHNLFVSKTCQELVAVCARDSPARLPLTRVTHLLDSGADPNVRDADGCTPLMFAARGGRADVVGLLLARGATVNSLNDAGDSAVSIARRESSDDVYSADGTGWCADDDVSGAHGDGGGNSDGFGSGGGGGMDDSGSEISAGSADGAGAGAGGGGVGGGGGGSAGDKGEEGGGKGGGLDLESGNGSGRAAGAAARSDIEDMLVRAGQQEELRLEAAARQRRAALDGAQARARQERELPQLTPQAFLGEMEMAQGHFPSLYTLLKQPREPPVTQRDVDMEDQLAGGLDLEAGLEGDGGGGGGGGAGAGGSARIRLLHQKVVVALTSFTFAVLVFM
jgi:hypothetical protein